MGRPDLAAAPNEKFGYSFVFNSEAEFIAFKSEAAALGFENLFYRKEYIYTRSEILSAPLLVLGVRMAPRGYGGPTYGTEYDLSQACPRCGSGAVQTSPLVLKRSELPKNRAIFQTLDDDILVSPELAEALRQHAVSGVELRQAVSHIGREPLPWYQIISHAELPPMSELTRGVVRERQCPVCNRDGHFGTVEQPLEIVYDARDVSVEELPDVAHTHERFGNGRIRETFAESHIPAPHLIVKPKVFLVLEEMKVRRVEFVPVRVVERPPQPA